MPGYFMGMVHAIKDGEAFGAYQPLAGATIEQYGGKMLWLSSKVEKADGDFEPMAVVMFEFESGEQARKWYNSPEYQAVIGQRLTSVDSNTAFIDVD